MTDVRTTIKKDASTKNKALAAIEMVVDPLDVRKEVSELVQNGVDFVKDRYNKKVERLEQRDKAANRAKLIEAKKNLNKAKAETKKAAQAIKQAETQIEKQEARLKYQQAKLNEEKARMEFVEAGGKIVEKRKPVKENRAVKSDASKPSKGNSSDDKSPNKKKAQKSLPETKLPGRKITKTSSITGKRSTVIVGQEKIYQER